MRWCAVLNAPQLQSKCLARPGVVMTVLQPLSADICSSHGKVTFGKLPWRGSLATAIDSVALAPIHADQERSAANIAGLRDRTISMPLMHVLDLARTTSPHSMLHWHKANQTVMHVGCVLPWGVAERGPNVWTSMVSPCPNRGLSVAMCRHE